MVNLTTEKIGFNERLVFASFKANANFEKFYPHWENRLKRIFLHFFSTTTIRGKYSRARRILYWMCEEEVKLKWWARILTGSNTIKAKQNRICHPRKFILSGSKFTLFPSIYCPCKVVKCGFFVTFATRRKYVVNDIFHHLCFKCNYCTNITFA